MKPKKPKLKKVYILCREIEEHDRECNIKLDLGAIHDTLKEAEDHLRVCECPNDLVILPVYRLED